MKEDIEDLIETYIRKIKACNLLIVATDSNETKIRVTGKKSAYLHMIRDLKLLLEEDEQDEA